MTIKSHNPADKVEHWPIDKLIPYARNARTHSEEQVAQIAASIKEWGFTTAVLVDESGTIIAGHGRVMAARKLGMKSLPVMVAAGWTDAQKRAYVIADNKLALNAGWDNEMLALELAELDEEGFDIALTGFEDAEIEALLADGIEDDDNAAEQDDGEPEAADDVPDAPVVPVSRTGDVWAIGQHRLICGDATDRAVVAALMAGDQASLCFTSPPYANQRDYTTGGIADWDALMNGVFSAAISIMRDDGQILVNLGLVHREGSVIPYWNDWLKWMPAQHWRFFGWYVWDQSVTVPGDWAGRLAPRHEFIFHFNRHARKPNKIVPCKTAGAYSHMSALNCGGGLRGKSGAPGDWTHAGQPTQDYRIPDSVITVTRQRGPIGDGIDHPAVFPVGLPQFVIESYTDVGEIVFEPFSGSGTTLIAAEKNGRTALLMELDPKYCDVIVKRWHDYTGQQAIHADTGKPFAEVEHGDKTSETHN